MIKEQQFDEKLHWYKDAVIYELHIKAFKDNNKDGIGDFKGLMEKLDYLQELGVTAIWLLPFYPSPLKDDGYDIADYYNIHTSYGNIEEFKEFLKEAHARQLRVITELVINHTSNQHPWFQRARLAPAGSAERNYYVWSDDPNKYKDVRIIFQDFETSNWSWDPVAQQYYWHRFFHHQPDLNYDSPDVQDEIFKIIDYWCAMGVDGFRLDAVPYLFEREGTNGENLPETHAFLKKLRKHVDDHFPGTLLLAEANMWPEDSASYFGEGDECQMNYHFPVMPRMFMALQMEDQYPLTDIFAQTPDIPENCQWAIFLRNHDELTLEMVTDEERDYMLKVYAKDPKARINLGIRHRLAPLVNNNRRKIELLNSLLFSLPGTPVIYYGDEIGMGDNFYLGDRDGVRTPMQWSPDRNAGFSETNPQKLFLPVIIDPEYHYETLNVETQQRNTSSLFWYMKSMISVRKKYEAFSRGTLRFIYNENPKVLCYIRTYKEETILVVVNFSKFSQAAEIELPEFKGYAPVEVMSRNVFPAIKEDSPYFFTLSPHSFHWFLLSKDMSKQLGNEALPVFSLNKWEDFQQPAHLEQFANDILHDYLVKSKWFETDSRAIFSVRVEDHIVVTGCIHPILYLLLEVSYDRGLSETYQLPVAFLTGTALKQLTDANPEAIIAEGRFGSENGILCDAIYVPEVQDLLMNKTSTKEKIQGRQSTLFFNGAIDNVENIQEGKETKKILPGSPAVTAIGYSNRFVLKIYRKVDRAANPDFEITKHLTETVKSTFTAPQCGTIEWRNNKDVIVLGMLQKMLENRGNAYSYMLEKMNNYINRVLAMGVDKLPPITNLGNLSNPVGFEELPDKVQVLLSARTAEQVKQFGILTGEMHKAMALHQNNPDFTPEPFSLHYQRSLFSSVQSLVRETFGGRQKYLKDLSPNVKEEFEALLPGKEELLQTLKRIYSNKLDIQKIRIHGNLSLEQFMLTGKDVTISDFLGNTLSPYSERRLKRSPLRDVASVIRSFYNVAYEGFVLSNLVQTKDIEKYKPYAILWAHFITGFYMKAYLETVRDTPLIPQDKESLKVVLQFYMLRNGLYNLNNELKSGKGNVIVPLRLIRSILNPGKDKIIISSLIEEA